MTAVNILIDESGDLGVNFNNGATKRYFIIGALVCKDNKSYKHILKSAERTIKNKLRQKKLARTTQEIKGWKTNLSIKNYFYKQCCKDGNWQLYFHILDKSKFVEHLVFSKNKIRLYNLMARELIDQIKLYEGKTAVNLYIDKHKTSYEEQKFNEYIETYLSTKISINTRINYYHIDSRKNKGIQAIDLFCTGIYEKYNSKKLDWYDQFREKIEYEEIKDR